MHKVNRRQLLHTASLLTAAVVAPALGACTIGGNNQSNAGAQAATATIIPTATPAATATTPATAARHTTARTTPAGLIDWKRVEQAMGKAGALQQGNVYKFGFPRGDLQVAARGVQLKPAFALGTHVEFVQSAANAAVYMGDLVLTEDEVNPVLLKLQQGGVELAALHNHLLGEVPRVMYLHIGGEGEPTQIASAIRAALELSKTPLSAPGGGQDEPADLDTRQLDQIMGHAGKANGGVYQFSVPRLERIRDHGVELPPAMGVAHAINFQPTGGGKAAITGDFVLLGGEVNVVSNALRGNGIDVTALHSHGLHEEPRLFYMHFWANDDAVTLAKVIRTAIETTNSDRGTR